MNTKNKSKIILFSALIVFSSGLFFIPKCFDAKATTPSTEERQKVSDKQLEVKASTSRSSKNSSASLSQNSSPLTTAQRQFSKQAVSQTFYIAVNNGDGQLSYEKASEEQIQEMETKGSNSKLSVHQVRVNGQILSVLSNVQN